jgi:hypothetical protein
MVVDLNCAVCLLIEGDVVLRNRSLDDCGPSYLFGVLCLNKFVAGPLRSSNELFPIAGGMLEPDKLPCLLFVNIGDDTAELVFCVYLNPLDNLFLAFDLTAELKSKRLLILISLVKRFDSADILPARFVCSLALFLDS